MLENSQHTLRVDKEGTLIFGEEEYYLGQYHFHTPSEHLINDEFYPMEMHLAFRAAGATDADPFTLAIGILFEVYADATTELLTTLAKCLPKTENQAVETGELIYGPIIRHFEENGLYQYQGSLTTPPCYQGITWLVSEKTMDVDVATFKAFKSIMKFNARYPQNTPGQENLITFAKDHYPEV
ncbi:hypothetical protein C0991_007785 [Blastosporella zonata]|nr:hypothetical protein C0991_007785 [Blastosporella zonata]